MDRLCQVIEALHDKLEHLRRQALKETSTRVIVIDPMLEVLGWDVRDPDEVQLEYPTVDGRSVDYALKINGKPVLLVEAKPLDDPLNDVKAIAQVVAYAANAGIVWCVLTNGVNWQVYRSVEECPAPEKLMFEVSLDPRESAGITVRQLAEQMWRFSRDEMAKGTLDDLGEKTFTDGKVRKALDILMRDPPRTLINLVRRTTRDSGLAPNAIRESLDRLWTGTTSGGPPTAPAQRSETAGPNTAPTTRSVAASKAWDTRRRAGSKRMYDEAHHTADNPQEALELYRALDRACLAMDPGNIGKRFTAKYIGYTRGKRTFCSVHIQRSGLRVWLKLKYGRLANAPAFARDVSHVGHWGVGDVELGITSAAQLPEALLLVRQSFDAQA